MVTAVQAVAALGNKGLGFQFELEMKMGMELQ